MTVLDQTEKRRPVTSATALPDLPAVRDEVDSILAHFLAQRAQAAPGPEMTPLFTTLSGLLEGGKRLRAYLCVAGWSAGGGAATGTCLCVWPRPWSSSMPSL
ncbi:hypothetical protein [Streptomyces albus]|uniref:hypothetical protein n=1 Tax=Streptomyces albus TaxID=1888 RepID=UPI001F094643|nr:hypothetical protein [Streptomyces albus]